MVSQIKELCQRSISDGDFGYEHNQELEKLCDVIRDNPNTEIWAPQLFKLIEEYDEKVDLTLGSPGPLVHTLESNQTSHEEFLLASLARQPTGTVIWMAERMSRSPENDKQFWLEKIDEALKHPKASEALRMAFD